MKKTYALLLLLIISISAKAQESFSFSLDEAIQYALQNNYTVRNAALDIDAAEKQKWEATSFGFPQIENLKKWSLVPNKT